VRYMISYDISQTSPTDYSEIAEYLKRLGAKRMLYSQWSLEKNNTTCEKVFNSIISRFNSRDRVLVTEITDLECSW